MAVPKKHSRRIVVDNIEYRWYLRHKPTYDQLIFGGKLVFAVEPISNPTTSMLVVTTSYTRPDSIEGPQGVIRPRDVEQAIRSARAAGWNPESGADNFHCTLNVGTHIEKI